MAPDEPTRAPVMIRVLLARVTQGRGRPAGIAVEHRDDDRHVRAADRDDQGDAGQQGQAEDGPEGPFGVAAADHQDADQRQDRQADQEVHQVAGG